MSGMADFIFQNTRDPGVQSSMGSGVAYDLSTTGSGRASEVNEALDRLADDYWQYILEVNPTQALMLGDHRFDDRIEDPGLDAENQQISTLRRFAEAAEQIDPA